MMRPLQVYLDESELERLAAWASERGWTKSQAVRAAIRALTRVPGEDPLLSASGMIEGLPYDCSGRFDHYLEETYIAENGGSRYRAKRRGKGERVRR